MSFEESSAPPSASLNRKAKLSAGQQDWRAQAFGGDNANGGVAALQVRGGIGHDDGVGAFRRARDSR